MRAIFEVIRAVVPLPSFVEVVRHERERREADLTRKFGTRAMLASLANINLSHPDGIIGVNRLYEIAQGEIGFPALIIGTNAVDDGMPDQKERARLIDVLRPILLIELVDRTRKIGEGVDVFAGGKQVPLFAFSQFQQVTSDGATKVM